jgi:hypothetical protein
VSALHCAVTLLKYYINRIAKIPKTSQRIPWASTCRIDALLRLYRVSVVIRVLRLLFTANFVPISPILVILNMEALSSVEISILKRATRRKIPEDGIDHSHRHESLRSYTR